MRQKKSSPPACGEKILNFFLTQKESESLSGDYEELFIQILDKKGKFKALTWYWIQILQSAFRGLSLYFWWSLTMFRSYLIIAFRHLRRHKIYSFVNIAGLAIAMTVVLFIFLYIQHEYSFDRFHANAERIHRLNSRIIYNGHESVDAVAAPAVSPVLQAECPEIEKAARLFKDHNPFTIHLDDKIFTENQFFYIDEGFFDVFSFPLITGDPKTVLSKPQSGSYTNNSPEILSR